MTSSSSTSGSSHFDANAESTITTATALSHQSQNPANLRTPERNQSAGFGDTYCEETSRNGYTLQAVNRRELTSNSRTQDPTSSLEGEVSTKQNALSSSTRHVASNYGPFGNSEKKQPEEIKKRRRSRLTIGTMVMHFTPNWFCINMGLGIASICLYTMPYQFRGLQQIGIAVFLLNLILFFFFLGVSIARYLIWPSMIRATILNPVQPFYFGAFSMAIVTLVNMMVQVGTHFGKGYQTFASVIWWISSTIAMTVAIATPFLLFARLEQRPEDMSALWIFPSVATIVGAASGSIMAGSLQPGYAGVVVITSYIMLGTGFCPAVLIMGVLFGRMGLHNLPNRKMIFTMFLPLGPCGQTAYATLRLSKVVRDILHASGPSRLYSKAELALFGDIVYAGSVPLALVIWGFGFFWLIIASSAVLYTARREGVPFNMGWWGCTFPVGTLATASGQLGEELDSTFFRVIGTILSICVILLALMVASGTIYSIYTGDIFDVPPHLDDEAEMTPESDLDRFNATKESTRAGGVEDV